MMSPLTKKFFENRKILLIHQVKEWAEILVNFETRNKFCGDFKWIWLEDF